MTTETETPSELSVSAGGASASVKSKRAAEFITVALLCLFCVLVYAFWLHREDSLANHKAQSEQFREMSAINKSMVEALREQTCLISIPESERKAEYAAPYGFCKRMAR